MSKRYLTLPSEGWEAYKNTAKRDVVFANFAYTSETDIADLPTTDEMKELAAKVPDGFQLFFCSDSLDETNKHKFRAAVFVNSTTKEVIIATSGTRFGLDATGRQDLYDDSFIAFEKEPPKMQSVRELNTMIIDSLGADIAGYKVHYTGHSLGAAVSDMAAADFAIKCRQRGLSKGAGMPEISTMTFENPGSKKVVEKMYKDAGLDPAEYSKDVDYKGINNGRNLINRTGKHAGTMWEIVREGEKDPNMFQAFLQYISVKLENFLTITPKLLNTLAFGRISKQIDSHKLTHIDDVLCGRVIGPEIMESKEMDERIETKAKTSRLYHFSEVITSCMKVMYESEIWSGLTGKKQKSGNIGKQEFVMVNPEGELRTASKLELASVVAKTAPRTILETRTGEAVPAPTGKLGAGGAITSKTAPAAPVEARAGESLPTVRDVISSSVSISR